MQSCFEHPGVAVGFDLWSSLFRVFPPISTMLKLMSPFFSSFMTFLILFANSPPGDAGTKMGAMCPPLVDHSCFSFLFLLFLSSFCQLLGLYRGLAPVLSSFIFPLNIAIACCRTPFLYLSPYHASFILCMYSDTTGATSVSHSSVGAEFNSLLTISWTWTLLLHADG